MLHGTDISRYQGTIDWDAFAPHLHFVAIRATRGQSYTDPQLARNRAEAARHRLIRGYYHFAIPAEDPAAQARHFCDTLGALGPGELDPILDLEWSQHHGKEGYTWTPCDTAYLQEWTRRFIAVVEQRFPGRSVILYTDHSFWQHGLGGTNEFTKHPLWIACPTHGEDPESARPPHDPARWAAWAAEKPLPTWAPWPKWTFWQFTRKAVLPGVTASTVHASLFNGALDDLRALAHLPPTRELPARVEGRIILQNRLPASRVTLRLYHRGFGRSEKLLGETVTNDKGVYLLRYDPLDQVMNLELRAVDTSGQEVPLSRLALNAAREETWNLVAPSHIVRLPSEFARLSSDVSAQIGRLEDLGRAREDAEVQDLAMLRRATGWDARLLALATLAVRRSTETGMEAEALYALFRAKLPTHPRLLARVPLGTVEKALQKAVEAGIVTLTPEQIARIKASFAIFARSARLTGRAPGALSSAADFLNTVSLTPEERAKFEDAFLAHRGAALWSAATEAGLPAEKIAALRLQGKLAHLTGSNAVLSAALAQEIRSVERLPDLADRDLHRAEAWKTRVLALAGRDEAKLQTLIPPAYAGGTAADRLDRYAKDMARKVRLSFPTSVVARMIETDEIPLGDRHSALKGPVRALLRTAVDLGFELGSPMHAFVQANRNTLFPPGTPPEEAEATVQAVKKLQRLYQITPGDESLAALARLGFGSAQHVTSVPYERFIEHVGSHLSVTDASLVYRKAQQVAAVTTSVLASAKLMDSAPSVYVLSPSSAAKEAAKANLIKHFPSLEQLFGSLDFCECEHCRSVLSPAAYFVDLLQFLERSGQAYAELTRRRPDLPHLPLTCENTNTALPYIDVVNEILEYQVAHGKLDAEAAKDTGTATTAELIAEPQYILPEVYDAGGPLLSARYPLSLPFDLWTDTTRRFLAHFEVPLWELLEAFRKSDSLYDSPADPASYCRADVFGEHLGLSRSERALFTPLSSLGAPFWFARWPGLYGFESAPEALGALRSAKTLSRRLGVSYKELVDLLRTDFINPGATTVRLADPDKGCNFDVTTLEYEGGDSAGALIFLKLNLFVRLRRKLGWSVDELDRALAVFLPRAALPLTRGNIGAALGTALVYLSHLKALDERFPIGRDSRRKWLALWSDLPAGGKDPLSAVALQTVQGLTTGDIQSILRDAGRPAEPASLAIEDVSALFRAGLLAKALRLSVPDFLVLKALSGLDPFRQLHDGPLDSLRRDHPFTQTLRFVEVAEAVAETGFSVEDLDYLLRHRFDPVGKYREDPAGSLALVRTIASETERIHSESVPPVDPSAATDEWLGQKLALALPVDVAAAFLDVWARLNALAASSAPENLATLQELRVNEAQPLFLNKLMKPVGFLDVSAFDDVFGAGPEADRRQSLTTALLPFLERRLTHQLILQTLSAALGSAPTLTDLLLTRAAGFLTDPTAPGEPLLHAFEAAAERGVTASFFGMGMFPSKTVGSVDTGAKKPDGTSVKPSNAQHARFAGALEAPATGTYKLFLSFEEGDASAVLRFAHLADPLLEGEADSGEERELEASVRLEAGVLYPFTVTAKNLHHGHVKLLVQGENVPKGSLDRLRLYPNASIERVRRARLLLAKVLQVTTGLALTEREVRHFLTYETAVTTQLPTWRPPVESSETRSQSRALFGLFLRLAAYVRLRREAAGGTDDLISVFEAALAKEAMIGDGLDSAVPVGINDVGARFAELTRRDPRDVADAAVHLGLVPAQSGEGVPGFANERDLGRVWRVLTAANRLGASVKAVAKWATPASDHATAMDLESSLQTRFDAPTWQLAAQPIFDALRQRRRDALVAYVLHHHPEGFENENELFEYFLIDPGMEPVVQTSRLRLAISSVQTFVQRCFLNLEPAVNPADVLRDEWEWRKRYRVWEANRKIFLYPENWLEPELRDDKSHLFAELEGALLQGDVSNDLAEKAFHRYLTGLDAIARLEIVTTHLEEGEDAESRTLHVIGRTHGLPHKYYYRTLANGIWAPWEPVEAEIEGDHVVAVVWRGRLHLFWATFMEKATSKADSADDFHKFATKPVGSASQKQVEIQLNFIEHLEGQWVGRSSGVRRARIEVDVEAGFQERTIAIHVTKEKPKADDEREAVLIHLDRPYHRDAWPLQKAFRLTSKNERPEVLSASGQTWLQPLEIEVTGYRGSDRLWVAEVGEDVLKRSDGEYRLVLNNISSSNATGPMMQPFFYEDKEYTLFADPCLTEVTTIHWGDWMPATQAEGGGVSTDVKLRSLSTDTLGPVSPPDDGGVTNSLLSVDEQGDWVIDQATAIALAGLGVGADGTMQPATRTAGDLSDD